MLSRSLSVGPELQRFCMCNFCSLQTSSQFQNSPGKCKWSEVRKHCTIYNWSNVKFPSPQSWRGTADSDSTEGIDYHNFRRFSEVQLPAQHGHAPHTHTTCISVNLSNYQVIKIVHTYLLSQVNHCDRSSWSLSTRPYVYNIYVHIYKYVDKESLYR